MTTLVLRIINRLLLLTVTLPISCMAQAVDTPARKAFDPSTDLLSLHYDHAPDKDDGQSAAADRSLLQTLFGADWISKHVVAVSGAYGKNAELFSPASDAVMDVAWNDFGGWLAAHVARDSVVGVLSSRWSQVLKAGGDVWVKEGGQSDLTASVVRHVKTKSPKVRSDVRIHVVQHSDWNEDQTHDLDLAYTKQYTDYIRIRDANAYLNVEGGDESFERAATEHPVFGKVWREAFDYYDPRERLDFSDTGELMHILGLGEIGIDAFRSRYLER